MRFGLALLAGVILLWGAGPLAISVAVGPEGGFGPLWLNGSRLIFAGLALLVVLLLRGRSVLPGPALGSLIGLGLVGWSLGSGLQVIAQKEVASGLAALVLSLGPALTLLFESAADRRPPALVHVLGASAGLTGIGLILSGGGLGEGAALGVLLLLGAAASWAGAAVLQARFPANTAPGVSAAWQMLAGGGGLVLAAVGTGEPLPLPSSSGLAAWAYLAVGAGAIGFLAWVEVLRRVPVVAAMSQPTLSTLVAVGLGHLLLGEHLGEQALLGIPLAVLGAAATLLPRDTRLPRLPWSPHGPPRLRPFLRHGTRPHPRALPVLARARVLARRARRRPGRLDV